VHRAARVFARLDADTTDGAATTKSGRDANVHGVRRMRATVAVRRAALALILCTCACACESSVPASSTRPKPVASDWTGVHDVGAPPFAPAAQAPKDSWVLHVGDSFVEAWLKQTLGPRIRATGSRYVVEAESATYTTTWAFGRDLDEWLAKRPSLVIVTLGANEVDMPSPGEHARAVEELARKIHAAGASCVWTTPPLWKPDTGILQVIHDHCAPCLYFDSDAVLGGLRSDERQEDHIHPNRRGGRRWADALWQWLQDHRDASRPWGLVPFEVRG
jgi:lysophospholipase L1-like esterase